MTHWLFKTEPDEFSLQDLIDCPGQTTCWDGIRNYQARNFLRQAQLDDRVFIYHSRTRITGIVGVARIAATQYPDPSQFDPQSKYYDARSDAKEPRWSAVDITYERTLKRPVALSEIKQDPTLANMLLVRQSRLSVMPVTPEEWQGIERLEVT